LSREIGSVPTVRSCRRLAAPQGPAVQTATGIKEMDAVHVITNTVQTHQRMRNIERHPERRLPSARSVTPCLSTPSEGVSRTSRPRAGRRTSTSRATGTPVSPTSTEDGTRREHPDQHSRQDPLDGPLIGRWDARWPQPDLRSPATSDSRGRSPVQNRAAVAMRTTIQRALRSPNSRADAFSATMASWVAGGRSVDASLLRS
jgi:hypothetical protein